MAGRKIGGDEYGVLLYYKYTQVPDLDTLYNFYQSNCGSLRLHGRIRLASHGVNVTVGGMLSALEKHIEEVKSNTLFEGTDFKLASCRPPLNGNVADECGFTSLSIRIVKELVTLNSHPLLKPPEISNAGKHLSAAGFHSVLQSAGKIVGSDPNDNKKLILLDARNLYETRIGKFQTPNVETLDPGIRQYSDLPFWIDNNSEMLRGNCVLMYCTGGIRCEMASAYIKSKGVGFENVFQLFGGIQRYLEQFPDGGYFRGRNFVFDHRISVASSDMNVMGTCLLCGSSFDDYSKRLRCSYCRMLVLVCDGCQSKKTLYECELCQKHHGRTKLVPAVGCEKLLLPPSEKLEAICTPGCAAVSFETPKGHDCGISCGAHAGGPPKKLKILCLHGFRQNASGFKGRTASLAKKLKNLAEFIFIDAPHELPFVYRTCLSNPPSSESCKKRFAWFVAPDFTKDGSFDPLQYQKQTEGFDDSLAYLESVISSAGPFDGILGFSQGAAMAAAVAASRGRLEGEMSFRFVILCSGFVPNLAIFERGLINCPSLHIFGGKDRQIENQASARLASLFEEGCSVVVNHDSGHLIPTRPPHINQVKEFLLRFLLSKIG